MGDPTTPTQETKVPTWAPCTPKRHTRPYFGCAERAYVQNAQNFHSWGVLGMRLPCVVFIQVHRQANAKLLTHIFITQVLHIQRMLGVLTEAFRVHPRATLHLPIVNSRDQTWRYFLQQQYQGKGSLTFKPRHGVAYLGSHEGFHTAGLGIWAVRTPEAIHESIIFIHKHVRMYMARFKQVNARTLPLGSE